MTDLFVALLDFVSSATGMFIGYILPFLIVLSVLIFFHELGHYLVARMCGVRVDVFSLGFGPELFGKNDRSGTRWKVCAIPFGGYVKMFGDADAASAPSSELTQMTEEERKVSFHHQPVGKRSLIVAAGPVANFILAVVLLAGIFMIYGQSYAPPKAEIVYADSAAEQAGLLPGDMIRTIDGKQIRRFRQLQQVIGINSGTPVDLIYEREPFDPVIGDIVPGSAAEQAGLLPGDTILEASGKSVTLFQEAVHALWRSPGANVDLLIARNGEELTVTLAADPNSATISVLGLSGPKVPSGPPTVISVQLTPKVMDTTDNFGFKSSRGMLGVVRTTEDVTEQYFNPFEAVFEASRESVYLTCATLQAVGQMIRGTRSAEELGGPLRIAVLSGQFAADGVYGIVLLMALLSINLGLINLFPIPILDGGHLLFNAIEVMRGRPMGDRAQEYGMRLGLAFVLFLMVFATWNDLRQMNVFEFFRNMIS
ncbi:MAG: RIP metalloprotease RseP [Pseudomonadota bacterium]|nr:RIP metalloprotease RseP [Pseudomonadota bacterium]